jgi:hypothetical protein
MKTKKTPPEQASIAPNTLWCLLLYSMRYALGRMSSAPSDVSNWIVQHRNHLAPWQVAQIAEEVEKELLLCESRGEYLGRKCDHDTWSKLVADLRSQQ